MNNTISEDVKDQRYDEEKCAEGDYFTGPAITI
jgi:hypothetical protein